jgi:hypothetical protein
MCFGCGAELGLSRLCCPLSAGDWLSCQQSFSARFDFQNNARIGQELGLLFEVSLDQLEGKGIEERIILERILEKIL